MQKYHQHPAMKLLHQSLAQERNLRVLFAIVLIGGGNWLGWYFFKKGNILAIFGLAALLLGMKLAWSVLRQPNIKEHPLFHILAKRPGEVVWVYSMNTQSMPFGFHLWDTGMMYFKLADGGEITVSLPAGKLKMVSKFLNRVLPHAAFGYSEERRQQFEKDPALLKK